MKRNLYIKNKVSVYKLDAPNVIKYILSLMVLLVVMLIFYLSWIDSPRLSYNKYIPKVVAGWADQEVNYNIRTAVPFLCLGLCCGIFLNVYKKRLRAWVYTLLGLLFLAIIAELGQLFLPLRSFDYWDVFWGTLGAALGLLVVYIGALIMNKNNIHI